MYNMNKNTLKILYFVFITLLIYKMFYKNVENLENQSCEEVCSFCKKCSSNGDIEKIKEDIEKIKESVEKNKKEVSDITSKIDMTEKELEQSKTSKNVPSELKNSPYY